MWRGLEGVRVLDLGQIYQGPYAGFLMAMAGAEVIKVEPPRGERLRRGTRDGRPLLSFAMLNANKRAITLDLACEPGRELFLELARDADVLIENFSPGVMEGRGVGYETLREVNPRLVYATGTGYGRTGPDRDQLAMDHTVQAAGGLMSITGERGGPPMRAGGAPVDILGGVHLYGGIVTALLRRERTGEGTLVEVAMQEALYFTLCTALASYEETGEVPGRTGNRSHSVVTPYGVYPCRDGWISVICVAEAHWQRLLEAIGREALAEDPRFRRAPDRFDHEAEVNALLEADFAARARDELLAALRERRVPAAPVRDLGEVRNDAHMHARGMLQWLEHPEMGPVVLANSPIRFPDVGLEPLALFPALGEHNAEVYARLGLGTGELARLKRDAVI